MSYERKNPVCGALTKQPLTHPRNGIVTDPIVLISPQALLIRIGGVGDSAARWSIRHRFRQTFERALFREDIQSLSSGSFMSFGNVTTKRVQVMNRTKTKMCFRRSGSMRGINFSSYSPNSGATKLITPHYIYSERELTHWTPKYSKL